MWYFRLSVMLLLFAVLPLPWIVQDPQLVSVDLLGAGVSAVVALLSIVGMVRNK